MNQVIATTRVLLAACGLLAASVALANQPLIEGLTLRSAAQFGAEEAVVWPLLSVQADNGQLTLQLADGKGALVLSPWPYRRSQQDGMAVGLPKRFIKPGAVRVTAIQTLQPFGPVQRLTVQQVSSKEPSMVVQTRGQSGQLVVKGWRAIYTGDHWVFQSELPAAKAHPSASTQRLRSQGRDWCVASFARPENQESPPLLDWILRAASTKGRCPT